MRKDSSVSAVSRAEIDLGALRHNFSALKKKLKPDTKILAVVKANAYGHGSTAVAKALRQEGVFGFGVAILQEALELRQSGIRSPILLLYQTLPDSKQIEAILEADLQVAVCTLDLAKALSSAAKRTAKKIKVHVKVDTGMGRLGIFPHEVPSFMKKLLELPGLEIAGLFSHFALAASMYRRDMGFTKKQVRLFGAVLESLKKQGLHIKIAHLANSAALLEIPSSHFDMVRPGLALYGLYPDKAEQKLISLKPVLSLKTRVIYIRKVPKGTGISYGHTYYTRKPTRIATLPIGYGDGYLRSLGNKAEVLIHGQRAPVVGVVCMDTCMVDVGHIRGADFGDEVVLIGRQGHEQINVEEIAGKLKTISYETTTLLSKRLPRVYIE